jgi:hypothetical protein
MLRFSMVTTRKFLRKTNKTLQIYPEASKEQALAERDRNRSIAEGTNRELPKQFVGVELPPPPSVTIEFNRRRFGPVYGIRE